MNEHRYQMIEGVISGERKRVAVVVSRFNSLITEKLLEGAIDCLNRNGTDISNVSVLRVPGAWEIPLIAQKAARSKNYDGIICLGAVIRGDTPHFDYVAGEVSKGIAQVSLAADFPVSFGVLTTDSVDQAMDRAGIKAGNKGWDAAVTLLEMMSLIDALEK